MAGVWKVAKSVQDELPFTHCQNNTFPRDFQRVWFSHTLTMGLCQSKLEFDARDQAHLSPGITKLTRTSEQAEVGEIVDLEETELSEADFSLVGLTGGDNNPSLQDFADSSGVSWLASAIDGTQMKVSLTAPIEFVARVWLNAAVHFTEGTDVGDMVQRLAQADTKKVREKREGLCTTDYNLFFLTCSSLSSQTSQHR